MPFSSLVDRVPKSTPRILINRDAVGPFTRLSSSRSHGILGNGGRDVFWEGDADDGVMQLAEELGWGDELRDLIKSGRAKLRKERGKELNITESESSSATGNPGLAGQKTKETLEVDDTKEDQEDEADDGGVDELQAQILKQLNLS